MRIVLTIVTLFLLKTATAQTTKEYKPWNPATSAIKVIEGQAWPDKLKDFYDRLPAAAEKTVNENIWGLSKNSAGLELRFQTNADEIIVKYTVAGPMQMSHMPATGVSGIDLYSKNIDGQLHWASGRYSFGDTVVYRFSNLPTSDQHVNSREYMMYLPLYNSVKWMEITVPAASEFKPLPVRIDKPIVVYGTSIAQGACATRPGLAWQAILGRKLDRPVINLGFSGTGKLEAPLLDLMATVDAKLYVLDCLPNMISGEFTSAEVKKRIVDAVQLLQKKSPAVPILLTDHAGYTDEGMNALRKKQYQDVNTAFKETFDSLIIAGFKNIYRLSKEAIQQDIETMVDGVHPNDIGMMRYADAYEKKIREIISEPVGNISTTQPISQRRDANTYDWETRHNQVMQINQTQHPELILIGNSITHFWGGMPASPRVNGTNAWKKYFGSLNVVNMGYGWDRIENVLWRIYHGELDNIAPKQIVMMIGTNNLQYNTVEEIVTGLQFLITAIQSKQPAANILLMGIFPRRNMEERVAKINQQIARIKAGNKVRFADAGKLFLKQQKIDESLFSDGLHPNEAGYDLLGAFITEQLAKKHAE
jgi:lysophospholipase L1-like esterase